MKNNSLEIFINDLLKIDENILNGIKDKLNNNKKLNEYELMYLSDWKRIFEILKRGNNEK